MAHAKAQKYHWCFFNLSGNLLQCDWRNCSCNWKESIYEGRRGEREGERGRWWWRWVGSGEGGVDKLEAKSTFSPDKRQQQRPEEINRKAIDKVKVNKSRWKHIWSLIRTQYLQWGGVFDTCPVMQTLLRMCVCVSVCDTAPHTSPGCVDVVTHTTLIASRLSDLKRSQKSRDRGGLPGAQTGCGPHCSPERCGAAWTRDRTPLMDHTPPFTRHLGHRAMWGGLERYEVHVG